jgi:hypothetical protein
MWWVDLAIPKSREGSYLRPSPWPLESTTRAGWALVQVVGPGSPGARVSRRGLEGLVQTLGVDSPSKSISR